MNLNKFTIKAQEAVQAALEMAANNNHQALEPAHLLKVMITDPESIISTILKKLGSNIASLETKLEKTINSYPVVKGAAVSGQYLSNDSKGVFDAATKAGSELGDEYISSEHLLIGLVVAESSVKKMLREEGVSKENILKILHAFISSIEEIS